MKILYIFPAPPNGVHDYAIAFKDALIKNANLEIEIFSGGPLTSQYLSQFDLVHIEISAASKREFILANHLRKIGFPYSLTLHDPPYLLLRLLFDLPYKVLRSINFRFSFLLFPWKYHIEKMIYQKARFVFTLSELGKKSLEDRLGKRNITILPHVSFSDFENVVLTKPSVDSVTTILYFGSIFPCRGIELVIEAVKSLAKQGINDFVLLICGNVLPEHEFYLKQLRTEIKGLEKIIKIRENIPAPEMEGIFRASDIQVIPYPKGKRNVYSVSGPMIRGMSARLVVIAGDVRAFSEEIEDMETGVFFKPGNVKSLTEKLMLLITDTQFRQELGKSAYSHINQHHNWPAVAKLFREKISK